MGVKDISGGIATKRRSIFSLHQCVSLVVTAADLTCNVQLLPTQYSLFVLVNNFVDKDWVFGDNLTEIILKQRFPRCGNRRNEFEKIEEYCQTACKPGSVRACARDDHSSGTRIAARLTRPTRAAGRKCPCVTIASLRLLRPPAAPIRSCSRWGLPCRPCHQGRGALLPHRFTLACSGCAIMRHLYRRFVFCGTVPGVAPAGR